LAATKLVRRKRRLAESTGSISLVLHGTPTSAYVNEEEEPNEAIGKHCCAIA